MPELPEVETTRRGLAPHIIGRRIVAVCVREPRLRWRVPAALAKTLPGAVISDLTRRAKYLLMHTPRGTLILHLGMSGSLRVAPEHAAPSAHDHFDIVFEGGHCLRLRDPRRFGSVHWTHDPHAHPLLRDLGPEPLEAGFDAAYLYTITRKRRVAIRNLLLNAHLIAGIGNIYANEALFESGIRPMRVAGHLTRPDCTRLVATIRAVLTRAIAAGGSTLRDFRNVDGLPGFFQQTLNVYGRASEPCLRCHTAIRMLRLGQRSAFYCPACQK